MARVSMIIPALNEEESIGPVVAEMPWHLIDECIVVDNGSTDRTAAFAVAAGGAGGAVSAWVWGGLPSRLECGACDE